MNRIDVLALIAAAVTASPALAQNDDVRVALGSSTLAAQAATTMPRADASGAALPVRAALRGVLAAREQGPEALRRYVSSTQHIYNYRFDTFAKAEWYER